MQAIHRDSARRLRDDFVRNLAPPELVRAQLMAVPAAHRDAWLDVLWDVAELPEDGRLPPGSVPYLPCPVGTVLEALAQACVGADDVFVDVGSGLGRAALLANALTGAGAIGIEIQPHLIRAARGRADWLNLERTRFVEGDAAELVRYMANATVFFLYCPFGGERIRRVLASLEELARVRPIRVCTVAMPRLDAPFLTARPSVSPELVVYRSVATGSLETA